MTKRPSGYRFGDVVVFTAVLQRRIKWTGASWRKEWTTNVHAKAKTGILIGWRTLANGYIDIEDGCCSFQATDHISAALVAFAPNRKPVLVPWTHITNDLEKPCVK